MSILNSTVFEGFPEKASIFCTNLFLNSSFCLIFFPRVMYFTGKYYGPSI
jgi:hypothetical protein